MRNVRQKFLLCARDREGEREKKRGREEERKVVMGRIRGE